MPLRMVNGQQKGAGKPAPFVSRMVAGGLTETEAVGRKRSLVRCELLREQSARVSIKQIVGLGRSVRGHSTSGRVRGHHGIPVHRDLVGSFGSEPGQG
jgi:hypothetical protein